MAEGAAQRDGQRQHGERQRQHVRVHIRQDEAEGRELVNRLHGAGQVVEVIIADHAAGPKPPPELPALDPRRRAYPGRVALLLIPEVQVLRRGPALLIRHFHENHVEIAEQDDEHQPQQGEEHRRGARRRLYCSFAPVPQEARPQQVVDQAECADPGQGEEQRHHQVEGHRAGDAAQHAQGGGHDVAEVVIADRIPAHPGIIGREGRAALDGAGESHFHRFLGAGQRRIERPVRHPADEQPGKDHLHGQRVLPVAAEPLGHRRPIQNGQPRRQHNQRGQSNAPVAVAQQPQRRQQPEDIADDHQTG